MNEMYTYNKTLKPVRTIVSSNSWTRELKSMHNLTSGSDEDSNDEDTVKTKNRLKDESSNDSDESLYETY